MDDLRPELRDEFAKEQAGLGDLAGARERLLQNARAAREHRGPGSAPLLAGVAAVLLAVIVVATFAYIRLNGGPPRVAGPLPTSSPTAPVATPTPEVSPIPSPSPSPSPSPEPSPSTGPYPTTSPVAGNAPPARIWAAMAYDPVRHGAVLFGGTGSSGFMNDTWTWDGSAWLQLTPALSPPRRQMSGMVWDAAQNYVLLFGGIARNGDPLNDTWAWDGLAWRQLLTQHSPSPRAPMATAYDASGSRVILFGGRQTAGTQATTDTWIWDGTDWTTLTTTSPEANVDTNPSIGLAWDPVVRQVTLIDWDPAWSCSSCNGGGIREWRLGAGGWSSPKYFQCGCNGDDNLVAYDPGRQRWLFYGAQSAVYSYGVTIFDGVNRTSPGEVQPHPAAARDDMAFAYDPDHQVILVFGGTGTGVATSQLWTWNFQSWDHLAG
jgi:hypothetical protein